MTLLGHPILYRWAPASFVETESMAQGEHFFAQAFNLGSQLEQGWCANQII